MTDIRKHIYSLVDSIEPYDTLEREHIEAVKEWIQSGSPLFRVESPDKPPKHLVSYFALVDPERRSVLLGDHRKAQLWLPTGGHVLPGEDPTETVRRESIEELGKKAIFLRGLERPLFLTSNVTTGLVPGHTDISLWYVVRGNVHEYVHYEKRELQEVNWFTFDEILESDPAIFDRHMHRFVRKLADWLG